MDPELPIHAVRADLEAALASGRPLVVTAPTGSGKSTCLPPWIAEHGHSVLVVEPRRVACRALALYLARERGERVGQSIGYRVRFDERVGPHTRVCFVTPGVALNLAAAGRLGDYAALMLDEFHERSWELDLLVAVARRATGPGPHPPKPQLIVCSATLALADLVDELDAIALVAEGRSFPVEIEYVGDEAPSERSLDRRVAAIVERTLDATGSEGDVLVFLPGKGEIERCATALRARPEPIVAVHGGISPERLVDAFAPARSRRVFLATNVAESSLTLPGVRTVIDSGLARMRMHRGGRSILALTIIARDSMDQRAGRAGRVAPGRCLRMWSRSFVPREITAPALERIELDDLILRAAACGLDADELADAPWIDAPPAFALEAARERLAAVGAIDARGRVSPRGLRLAQLPVAGERARMLLGVPPRLSGAVADLVALLEHRRSLWLRDADGTTDEARAALVEALGPGVRDEVHAALLALRRGHARRHGLHPAGLAEVRRLSESLRQLVGAPRLAEDREALPERGELAAFLLERVPEAAFVRRARTRARERSRSPASPWANGEIELQVRDPSVPGLAPEDGDSPPDAGLILDHEWIGVGQRATGRGRMLLPCSRAALAERGLGERVLGPPQVDLTRAAVRSIAATVERRLAGVCLASEVRELDGEALRTTLAELILAGRRLPPLTRALPERVRDELHLWAIAREASTGPLAGALAGCPPLDPAPEPAQWLAARLAALGLETIDELALLADEDLHPRSAALAELETALMTLGERDWTLDALAQDFPRVFVDRDAHYHCHVRLARRRVTLEPLDALARKRGEPKPELLPRLRGFAIVFRQASRRVVLR